MWDAYCEVYCCGPLYYPFLYFTALAVTKQLSMVWTISSCGLIESKLLMSLDSCVDGGFLPSFDPFLFVAL